MPGRDDKKSHGAGTHRGTMTQGQTVTGRQAHSEQVFCCGHEQSGSDESRNALLSSGFLCWGSLHQEEDDVKTI
jgi:hypothetical protein